MATEAKEPRATIGKKTPRKTGTKRRAEDEGEPSAAADAASECESSGDLFNIALRRDFEHRMPSRFDIRASTADAITNLVTKINTRVIAILAHAETRVRNAARDGEFECTVCVDTCPSIPASVRGSFDFHVYLSDCMRNYFGNGIKLDFTKIDGYVVLNFEMCDE